jgi:hypothetical protein
LETGFDDVIDANEYVRKDLFRMDYFENEAKKLKLYKLHGSIDWEKAGNDIKYTNEAKKSEVIFGISQKYKAEEPYSLLYAEFKRSLVGHFKTEKEDSTDKDRKPQSPSPKILIVIGYSFHDPHINDAIYAAMRRNKELKLFICDPGLIETHYFMLPQTLQTASTAKDDFIRDIVKSEDYEVYVNMAVILHSVYYSRNFDEDALFLSACVDEPSIEKNMIQYTEAASPRYNNGQEAAIAILKNILGSKQVPLQIIKDYFTSVGSAKDKEKRNKAIYDHMPGVTLRYREIADCIDSIKTRVYKLQKDIDREGRAVDGQGSQEFFYRRAAALELIDDLRMIEKFIKDFIPVHLSLMFGSIEKYQQLPNGNHRINLSMHIFELYLKYNYLIDAIEIKLTKIEHKKSATQTKKSIYAILGELYCIAFARQVKEMDITKEVERVNYFLRSIKNSFLIDGLDNVLKDHAIIRQICDEESETEFQDIFLTWSAEELNQERKGEEWHNLNRVLYKPEPYEKKIQLKIMLYSKGLAKSMVDRFSHAERLLHDLNSMITILHEGDETTPESKAEEFFSKLQDEIHFSRRFRYEKGMTEQAHLTLVDGFFWNGEAALNDVDLEVNNKVPTNLNWYVNRFFRLQKELTDTLFTVKFDLPEKPANYWKNLCTYARLFGKTESAEWKALAKEIHRYGTSVFYADKTWKTIDQIFCDDKGASYLDRLSVCHFPSKIFFTKTLRGYTLFRTYYSTFFAEEHLRSFCDINRMIVSRRPSIQSKTESGISDED